MLNQSATKREVVEHFLRLEMGKGDRAAEEIILQGLSDDDGFFRNVRDYADREKMRDGRIIPALVWSVGVDGDNRYREVS